MCIRDRIFSFKFQLYLYISITSAVYRAVAHKPRVKTKFKRDAKWCPEELFRDCNGQFLSAVYGNYFSVASRCWQGMQSCCNGPLVCLNYACRTTTHGRPAYIHIETPCIATGDQNKDKKVFLSADVSWMNGLRRATTRLCSFFLLHQAILAGRLEIFGPDLYKARIMCLLVCRKDDFRWNIAMSIINVKQFGHECVIHRRS